MIPREAAPNHPYTECRQQALSEKIQAALLSVCVRKGTAWGEFRKNCGGGLDQSNGSPIGFEGAGGAVPCASRVARVHWGLGRVWFGLDRGKVMLVARVHWGLSPSNAHCFAFCQRLRAPRLPCSAACARHLARLAARRSAIARACANIAPCTVSTGLRFICLGLVGIVHDCHRQRTAVCTCHLEQCAVRNRS